MDLVKVYYGYLNRCFDSKVLIDELMKLGFMDEANNIKTLKEQYNNEIDEKEKEKQKNVDRLKGLYNRFLESDADDGLKEKITLKFQKFLEEESIPRDSGSRYKEIVNYLKRSKAFIDSYNNLNTKELLEVVSMYIKADEVFCISKKKFNELVDYAILKNDLESLWRLAFNYSEYDMDFKKLVDYYFNIKDAYYLTELIHVLGDKLDLKDILKKVKSSKNAKFKDEFYDYMCNMGFYEDEELESLKSKM